MLTGVGVVVTAFTIFLFWPDPNADVRALPSPNGFNDLVKAAQLLPETQDSSFDYRTAELTELRESVGNSNRRRSSDLPRSATIAANSVRPNGVLILRQSRGAGACGRRWG